MNELYIRERMYCYMPTQIMQGLAKRDSKNTKKTKRNTKEQFNQQDIIAELLRIVNFADIE